jgi:hypothetical protein
MSALFSYLLLASLVAHAAAHLALLVLLARRPPRYRALVAFVLPPLAPYYGWMGKIRHLPLVWLVSLGAYSVGVALANM